MLEDTTLHESFTTLVWLMIAISKKFKMKKYIYEWILGVVYLLCVIKVKDNIKINDKQSLINSINIRILYGGTTEDLEMMTSYIDKLKNVNKTIIRPISLFVKELTLEDWDLSAIDYHCNSYFLEYISKKYDNYDIEELKRIIDKRVPLNEYEIKIWNEIKDYVKKTQKYLLNTSY